MINKGAKRQAYWYRFWLGECPLCGKDQSYKERVYGPKPEDDNERYKYSGDCWCGCSYG